MSGARGDLAGYGARVGATLLDTVLITVVASVTASVAIASGAPATASGYVIIGVVVLSFLFYAPVLMCRSGSHNGQTLGKQALSIRVVREDAQPMTASPALLREFVGKGLLGLIPFFTIVDFLFPLGDARRQAIHDKLASTFVVHADAVPDLERSAPGAPEAWDPPSAAIPSGWAPPAPATPAAPPASSDWARPAPPPDSPAEPNSGEDHPPPAGPSEPPTRPIEREDEEEVRGPFGPSSSDPR
ncbi:MAG: RDD family protein [Actinomycetota bacterium]|nr:RDD family protein [Actinomycetota bacterium]